MSNAAELISQIATELELPDYAYEKAQERYEDLGKWLRRPESLLAGFDPHVFPQGSFRLGTPVRPLSGKEEYDLDVTISLRKGVDRGKYTQAQLKELVRKELEAYRQARGIKEPLEEKRRCWRLSYQDGLGFHIDEVPCIPADEARVVRVRSALQTRVADWRGLDGRLPEEVQVLAAQMTVFITDREHPDYDRLCDDWLVSNPQGYALWFTSRMVAGATHGVQLRAQIDDFPAFLRATCLQRVVQILKRHRDVMFQDFPDLRPPSIIITTLAAQAYNGERTVEEALGNILREMKRYVGRKGPRVPNPVDPEEDFADAWQEDPKLEENFWRWLEQAQNFFGAILGGNAQDVTGLVSLRLSVTVNVPGGRPKVTPAPVIKSSGRPWGNPRRL